MKVLILTSKFGLGHYHAATTLAELIQESDLGAETMVADIYELAYPKYCGLFYTVYSNFLSKGLAKGSKLYNFAYTRTVYKEQGVRAIRSYPKRYIQSCLAQFLAATRPDLVVSTYSFCSQLMSDYKQQTGDPLPLVTCVTDVTSHNLWTNPLTDLYLVAAETTKQSLIAQGVEPGRIVISGIPVARRFKQGTQQQAGQQRKELLVMGGGLGLLPGDPAFYEALNQAENLHTTIITGQNKKLYEKLQGRYANITVLGFSDRVAELMAGADLLLSKPGGISMFEAIQSELPLVLFQPFLEQEIRNSEYLLEQGVAVMLPGDPVAAARQIERLLADETGLARLRNQMRQIKASLQEEALLQYLASRLQKEVAA